MHFVHERTPFIVFTDAADRVRFLLPAGGVTHVTEKGEGCTIEYRPQAGPPRDVAVLESFAEVCKRLEASGAPVIDDRTPAPPAPVTYEGLAEALGGGRQRRRGPGGFGGVGDPS